MFIDVESAPILAAIWPPIHETNAVWIERGTHLNCFAAMWLGDKKPKVFSLPDYPSFKKDIHSDKALLGDLHSLLCDPGLLGVAAHNGRRFDMKLIRTRLLLNGYPPPPNVKEIDTLVWLRSIFKLDSNRLDAASQALDIGRKMPTTGKDLWRDCYHGSREAFATMGRYCAHDVELLARTYERIKAWAPGHLPISGNLQCTACQSSRLISRGSAVTRKRHYRRLQCAECGHWQQGELIRERAAG